MYLDELMKELDKKLIVSTKLLVPRNGINE